MTGSAPRLVQRLDERARASRHRHRRQLGQTLEQRHVTAMAHPPTRVGSPRTSAPGQVLRPAGRHQERGQRAATQTDQQPDHEHPVQRVGHRRGPRSSRYAITVPITDSPMAPPMVRKNCVMEVAAPRSRAGDRALHRDQHRDHGQAHADPAEERVTHGDALA